MTQEESLTSEVKMKRANQKPRDRLKFAVSVPSLGVLIGLATVYLAVAGSVASATAEHSVVITEKGLIQGVVTPTVREFLGIPYAAPPVGDLRWRPPQAHARWLTPIKTTKFGNHCPQDPSPFETTLPPTATR